MDAIRYGILSTSSIAPRFIAAVREAGAGEIVALSSRSLEKGREKARDWEIPKAYGSHLELLEDPEVNVVYISTVNAQHEPWARKALEHGKHVICEKPCTTTAAFQASTISRKSYQGFVSTGAGEGALFDGSGKDAVFAGGFGSETAN